jgi:hypothetical protein
MCLMHSLARAMQFLFFLSRSLVVVLKGRIFIHWRPSPVHKHTHFDVDADDDDVDVVVPKESGGARGEEIRVGLISIPFVLM